MGSTGTRSWGAFLHTVMDDHSRVAYAEVHDDKSAVGAIAVPRRAEASFGVWDQHRAVLSETEKDCRLRCPALTDRVAL